MPRPPARRAAARELFERSGLSVNRVTITHRGGRPYLFVSADFKDVNRLAGTAAFPDFEKISLGRDGERLDFYGLWKRPPARAEKPAAEDGLMAVRFLPSKVYEHKNAHGGVERGNIVGWGRTSRRGWRAAPRVRRGHGRAQHPVVHRRRVRALHRGGA